MSRAEIRLQAARVGSLGLSGVSQGFSQKTAFFISTEGSGAEIKIPEETRVSGFIIFRMTENTVGPVCECVWVPRDAHVCEHP